MKAKPKDWWTKPRVLTLKVRWAQGFFASEIAEELGTTRASVIGKVHRLQLPAPLTKHDQKPRARSRVRPTPPAASPRVASPPVEPPTGPVHFGELERQHCRWMPGEVNTMMFCGDTRSPNSPYCAKHTALSYTPSRVRSQPA